MRPDASERRGSSRRRKAVTGNLVPRPTKSRTLASGVKAAVLAARGDQIRVRRKMRSYPCSPVALAQTPNFELCDGHEVHESPITPAEPLWIELHRQLPKGQHVRSAAQLDHRAVVRSEPRGEAAIVQISGHP